MPVGDQIPDFLQSGQIVFAVHSDCGLRDGLAIGELVQFNDSNGGMKLRVQAHICTQYQTVKLYWSGVALNGGRAKGVCDHAMLFALEEWSQIEI